MANEQNKENPADLNKNQGYQQQSYKDYMALKRQKENQKKRSMPPLVKYILLTPIILIFCAGIFFIPYMIFSVLTAPPAAETAAE
ncbi:MAG: hypothetical protein ACLFPX_07910 [Candidatus Omnitrophota bacterium]